MVVQYAGCFASVFARSSVWGSSMKTLKLMMSEKEMRRYHSAIHCTTLKLDDLHLLIEKAGRIWCRVRLLSWCRSWESWRRLLSPNPCLVLASWIASTSVVSHWYHERMRYMSNIIAEKRQLLESYAWVWRYQHLNDTFWVRAAE